MSGYYIFQFPPSFSQWGGQLWLASSCALFFSLPSRLFYMFVKWVKILKGNGIFRRNNSLDYIQAAVPVFLLFSSAVYTKRDAWQKLTLFHRGFNKVFHPAAPANRYLHPDDLRIFKEIKGKIFLSAPWKGTVIGVATDNYPLIMKPGTISGIKKQFGIFMNGRVPWKI